MYTLRVATVEDAAFVYQLHRSAMQDYVAQTWGTWDEAFQAEMFGRWFVPARFQIVVVEGQDVGLLATDQRAAELFLDTLEILPAYQNQGLGSALIRDILAQGHAAGLPVALQVLKVNPAQRLYARLGFRIVGETATHYLMRTANHEVGAPDR